MKIKPRILLIIGNQQRHKYFASVVNKHFNIVGIIFVDRGLEMPLVPEELSKIDKVNFKKHFEDRLIAEKNYCIFDPFEIENTLNVAFDELNSDKVVKFVSQLSINFAFIFGSGLIGSELLKILPIQSINLHLGLSPRYRGAATLFWPFYFLEPNFAGATFHYLSEKTDAGDIIHQVVPILQKGDKIHDVACKTIVAATDSIISLINIFINNGEWRRKKQTKDGKNFLSSDFHPTHLRLIYNTFSENIVDEYLDKKLNNKSPKLFNQFQN